MSSFHSERKYKIQEEEEEEEKKNIKRRDCAFFVPASGSNRPHFHLVSLELLHLVVNCHSLILSLPPYEIIVVVGRRLQVAR